MNAPHVAVGGVGGSGTRVVAQLLRDLGVYIGSDLNESEDNLWFTLLFKRPAILEADDAEFGMLVNAFVNAMSARLPVPDAQAAAIRALAHDGRVQHGPAWLTKRADTLLDPSRPGSEDSIWGWKEPNTHLVIERLLTCFPDLRYVHVMRNGLDMAFSGNQNQLEMWGPHFLAEADADQSPRASLKYWCVVHRRILDVVEQFAPRALLLNFDEMCDDPVAGVRELVAFCGFDATEPRIADLARRVKKPASVGRFRSESTSAFDAADLAFARSLGFPT